MTAQPRRSSGNDADQHMRSTRRRRAKTRGADRSTKASEAQTAALTVSVVIPTHRRPALLDRCLEALVKQRLDPATFEIVVVDDAPSLETRAVVAKWTARALGRGPVIGYLPVKGPGHGPAAARNIGWRAAIGDIIAFTSDDAVPDSDWLQSCLQTFKGDAQAAWGRVVTPLFEFPNAPQLEAQPLKHTEFAATNCFCLKHVLETVNGFDERFQLPAGDDADLYFRLLRYQARIVYLPDALVLRLPPPAPWGSSLWRQKDAFFDALLFKKHPTLYRTKVNGRPRWEYYLVVAALLSCLLGILFAEPALAATTGALWLALTGRYCLQRLRHASKAPRAVAEIIVTSALIPPMAVFWRLAGAIRFRVGLI